MELVSRTIRLFVSSTFNDLKAERNALQSQVFPRLQRHCEASGWSFQAIDLRWGVSTEASLDQSAMRICLAEIARCQTVTPRPNFLVLLGDRYGWRPLPEAIPAAEFTALRDHLPIAILDELTWSDDQPRGWYRLDENAVVPLPDGSGADKGMYMLRPRTGRYVEDNIWAREVERPVGIALRNAARAVWAECDARRLKYDASATEQEIVAGALTVPDADKHVCAFFRRIELADGVALRNMADAQGSLLRYRDFVDLLDTGRIDTDAVMRLETLKDRLSRAIGRRERQYVARWQGSGPTSSHLKQFVEDVHDSLKQIIDAQIGKHALAITACEEPLRHWAFAERRARDFVGRGEDLQVIYNYVRNSGASPPLIVHGDSGAGKSALLAHAALSLRLLDATDEGAASSRNRAVMSRFVGATPASGEPRSLLEEMCRELGTIYGISNDNLALDVNRLAVEFRRRLAFGTAERPLVLFIDALDQLPSDSLNVLTWLPRQLGRHVRIVLSMGPGKLLQELLRDLHDAHRHELPRMARDDGRALLARWLRAVDRRLTPDQFEHVIANFAHTGLPLYLRLAFTAARFWPSYDAAPPLSDSVAGVVNAVLDRLSADSSHGALLLNRVLGYLSSARQGCSESELLELLARDDAYWNHLLARARHDLPVGEDGRPVRQVPVVIWSRLFYDLEPYLSWRSAHGATLMTFFHPTTLLPAVRTRFLQSDAERQQRHAAMARFFVDAARGEDRGDPWISDSARGFAECVFHLVHAGEVDQAVELLTSLAFIAGKARHGLVFDLQDDYTLAIGSLPELQQELERERWQAVRLARWGEELTEYSRQWRSRLTREAQADVGGNEAEPRLPQPPPACCPWSEEQIDTECKRLLEQPTRADRIRAFQAFVRAECYTLLTHSSREGFIAQHAVARLPSGPVNAAARAQLSTFKMPLLLRRWPKGSVTNAKSALLLNCEGHRQSVSSLSVTPDSRIAVSGSADHTLRVWDLESGVCLSTLEGHSGEVTGVGVTADGRMAVSCSDDKTLRVWNLDSSACLHILEGHDGAVKSLSITPDGKTAISGSDDFAVGVWDLGRGVCLHMLQGHDRPVTSVGLTPDGRIAVSGGDSSLRVWQIQSGKCLRALKHVKQPAITADLAGASDNLRRIASQINDFCALVERDRRLADCLAITPDGRHVISGSIDSLLFWDITGTAAPRALDREHVQQVSLTSDGRIAVAAGVGSVKVWDLESGLCLRTLECGSVSAAGSLTSVSVTTDARRVISGSEDTTVRVWDLESGRWPPAVQRHTGIIACVCFTPDSRRAISASWDNSLRVWDPESGICLRVLSGHREAVTSVSVTPDGRLAVSGSEDNTLRIWQLDTGVCLRALEGHHEDVTTVCIAPDGRRAVSGGSDNTVRVWDLEQGVCLSVFDGHENLVTSVNITPDARHAVSGAADHMIRIWDLNSGICTAVLEGHTGAITSVSITPDGRRAVSASWDKTVRVWNLAANSCERCLQGHDHLVYTVSVTPDGQHALSGSWDKTARVWNLHDGRCTGLYSFPAAVHAIAVAPNGEMVCAAAHDFELSFLELKNIPRDLMILTATAKGTSRCIACYRAFVVPSEVIAAIEAQCPQAAVDQSPCLNLPDDAFADTRLISKCPHCNAPVKFNPFVLDTAGN